MRLVRFIITIIGVVIIIGVLAVAVIDQSNTRSQVEQRRVAYAATATQLVSTPLISPAPILSVTPLAPPTPTPQLIPTTQDLAILPTATPTIGEDVNIPAPIGLLPEQTDYELVNFLLAGSDRRSPTRAYRTDVILIMSVNWTTQTVNLLSIPRDLYVYIPGWGMDRINTAELHQTQTQTTHHRLGLLAETIEYNLGIRIDHIARVDFEAFESWVDLIGGITVPVDCPTSGYQLNETETAWVPFALEPGMHDLDGALALWYVRQRIDSSDFDRNRRQQIVLRAIWRKSVNSELVGRLPELWNALTQSIETDVTLDQALMYAPLFMQLNADKIESHFLGLDEVDLAQTPNGSSVLAIDPEPFYQRLHHFLTPPTLNRLSGEQAIVEVLNASSFPQADQLAAAQLNWAGIIALTQGGVEPLLARTTLYDYTGQVKGSSLATIRSTLGLADTDVLLAQPSDPTNAHFRLILGENYRSCQTSAWRAFAQPE